MVGAPQVAETTDAGGSAGFGTASSRSPSGRTRVASGGMSSAFGSVIRKHCIQQAEIDYVQNYDLVAVVQHREADVVVGGILALLGGAVILGTKVATSSIFEPGDPLYEEPGDPTAGYTAGGVMIAGGVAVIGYSFAALPKGAPPPTTSHERRWTATEYVESSGCGLVPGDRAQAPLGAKDGGDAGARLRQLERLYQSGLLSDQEYEAKRRELLDQL